MDGKGLSRPPTESEVADIILGLRTCGLEDKADVIRRLVHARDVAEQKVRAWRMEDTGEALVAEGFRRMLLGLGFNLDGDAHMVDTPVRAARAWYHELCRGLTEPEPVLTTFPTQSDEMVVLRDIPIRSVCAHHLLPFFGTAVIAYVPGTGRLLGVSKLSRAADYWARRPQVQEELTNVVADYLARLVVSPEGEGGVGVVIRARHLCMELRGVQHRGDMVTSALRGVFLSKPEARAEFLQLSQARCNSSSCPACQIRLLGGYPGASRPVNSWERRSVATPCRSCGF